MRATSLDSGKQPDFAILLDRRSPADARLLASPFESVARFYVGRERTRYSSRSLLSRIFRRFFSARCLVNERCCVAENEIALGDFENAPKMARRARDRRGPGEPDGGDSDYSSRLETVDTVNLRSSPRQIIVRIITIVRRVVALARTYVRTYG